MLMVIKAKIHLRFVTSLFNKGIFKAAWFIHAAFCIKTWFEKSLVAMR